MSKEVHWLANYVMLSRGESLESMLIWRLCTREELTTGAPAFLRNEIDRLLLLEHRSWGKLRARLAAVSPLPPLGPSSATSLSRRLWQQRKWYSHSTGTCRWVRAAINVQAAPSTFKDASHSCECAIGPCATTQHNHRPRAYTVCRGETSWWSTCSLNATWYAAAS